MCFVRRPRPLSCSIAVLAVLTLSALSGIALNAQALVSAKAAAPAKGILTLDPLSQEELAAQRLMVGASAAAPPENFRQFDAVSKGQIGETKTLTLRFAAAAKLMRIKSTPEGTPEFKMEQGGSCVEGFSYAANSTCTLLVRSTPQGPGHRLGKLEITNSVDAKPLNVGLGGNGYAPTVSFTPSIITTVPATLVSNAGLINGAMNLAIDSGDTLYIADTGNNLIRYIDSSGIVRTASTSASAPYGVAVDSFGEIFFDEPAQGALFEIFEYGAQVQLNGSGNPTCTYSAPCNIENTSLYSPGQMAINNNDQLFFANNAGGAALSVVEPYPATFAGLTDPFTYLGASGALTVDANDNLYSYYGYGSATCAIVLQSFYNAVNGYDIFNLVAGGRTCGFSGDGGQAHGAEIGTSVGQITFDIAGNLYFSDTANQRVRRVDGSTGIITTIAGNGNVGYGGDGGPATSATLNTPTGVTVDSQGQVYILSNSATTGSAQVVRKVGVVGALNLGSLAVGTASTAQTVQLANTGNSELDFTHVGFSSGNTTDFAIDPNTTSCNFTVPLQAGRSCKIGFIFTPSATGARSAVLSITDDTIAGVNTIQLSGTGYTTATLTPASLSFASTTVGSSTASQTATLTNTGKAAMTISSILFSGAGATSYTDTTTCGATLAVGASCTIAVTFKPVSTGTLTATLTVTDNAIGGKQTVSLTGVGVAAAKAGLSPASLAFGSETVAVASAAKALTLSNTGGSAMTISSYAFSGTNSADFTETTTCVSPLAAGANCTINVVFKPAAAGARAGTLTVNTSGGNVSATLTGTGVAATTAPRVALTSMANPMPANSTLMLTAAVTGSSSAKPTGSVELMEGTKVWAEGALSAGTVTFKLSGMTAGVHLLDAVYIGDAKNSAMTSAILRQVVGAVPVTNPTAPPVAPVSQ
jgi:hypothetical protein